MEATCPICLSQGPLGSPCGDHSCGVHGVHRIPLEHVAQFALGPGPKDHYIGQMMEDYLLVQRLGRGGFGSVYLALQMPVEMPTALKVLHGLTLSDSGSEAEVRRFALEAQALARLFHPNIVRLIKFGSTAGTPYLVMEYVKDGIELRKAIESRNSSGEHFSFHEIRHILRQILNALDSAHQTRIVHRDIKPANLMLQPVVGDPLFVRILDFGLAKLMEGSGDTTTAKGTPLYMAPEQIVGRNLGPWTDLYAVALILGELLIGRRPFDGRGATELMEEKSRAGGDPAQVFGCSLPLPDVLSRFLCCAAAPVPEQRFQSAPEFLFAMETLFGSLEEQGIVSLRGGGAARGAGGVIGSSSRSSSPKPDDEAETVDASSERSFSRGLTQDPSTADTASAEALPPTPDRAAWLRPSADATAVTSEATLAQSHLRAQSQLQAQSQAQAQAAAKRQGPKPRRFFLWIAVALALCVGAAAWFLSNAWKADDICLALVTEGKQDQPGLGVLPNGTYLATWVSSIGDNSGSEVLVRKFDETEPMGPPFSVSTRSSSAKSAPTVSTFSDGRSMILWTDEAQSGKGEAVFGRWLASDGSLSGGELPISSEKPGVNAQVQSAAVFPDDRVVVVWQTDGRTKDGFAIVAQLLGSDGNLSGDSWPVHPVDASRQWFPSVASQAEGFLVVWENMVDAEKDIQARLFDAEGKPLTGAFVVNTTSAGEQRYPSVASIPGRGYVVVWNDSSFGVWGQNFDLSGSKVGQEYLINSRKDGRQWLPKVASDSKGNYAVAWFGGQDGAGSGVVAQFFGPDGTRLGAEFVVNRYTEGEQRLRCIQALPDGRFVAAWESQGQDGSGWGAYARVFGPASK